MEKTTNIMLGGVRFDMSDEAYRALDSYLASLSRHLAQDPDMREIVRDIEARIAEKLTASGERVISLGTVESVTKQMGSPEDIATDDAPTPSLQRKLYRDEDNAVIGGVASGMSAYFGIDPIFVRIVFIASIFVSGFGILIYVLLWLLIPRAETAAQKLEMRGNAVTFESMRSMVRERGESLTENGTLRRILYFPFEVVGTVLRGIRRFSPKIGKALGFLLALASFFAFLSCSAAYVFAFANLDAPYREFPLLAATSPALLYGLMTALYVVAAVPFVLLFAFAQRLMRSTMRITTAIGFGLIGLWSLAVIVSASLGFKVAEQYNHYLDTAPEYQEVTEEIALPPFQAVEASGSASVVIASGPVQSVSVTASARDIDRIVPAVTEGVLTVEILPQDDTCFLCDFSRPVVAITTPNLSSVTMQQGQLELKDVATPALTLDVRRMYVSGDVVTQTLTLIGDAASVTLEGSAQEATIILEDANLYAQRFPVGSTTIEARTHSFANISVLESLKAFVDEQSSITYRGTPAVVEGNAVSADGPEDEAAE